MGYSGAGPTKACERRDSYNLAPRGRGRSGDHSESSCHRRWTGQTWSSSAPRCDPAYRKARSSILGVSVPDKPRRCQKRRGESWRNRHKRRFELAVKDWQRLKRQCRELGLDAVREKDENDHEIWAFYRNYQPFATWNPWSANASAFGKCSHIHDSVGILEYIRLQLHLLGCQDDKA